MLLLLYTYISEQSHFKVCFWPFGFINNPASWKCFFLSRTVNKSGSEIFTKLESWTDDLTCRNSHFDLVTDRAYKFNMHVDNAATRGINDTLAFPRNVGGTENSKENLVARSSPNQVNRIELPLKLGY